MGSTNSELGVLKVGLKGAEPTPLQVEFQAGSSLAPTSKMWITRTPEGRMSVMHRGAYVLV